MKKNIFFTILAFAAWLSLSLIVDQDLDAAPKAAPQAIPYTEDFEGVWSGGAPELWSREYVGGSIDWIQSSGGEDGHPPSAHGGSYNALFSYCTLWGGIGTRLITPPLNFGPFIHNARLTFWYTVEEDLGDRDYLYIYYRSSTSGDWISLAECPPEPIPYWREKTINLPNPGSDYYICFSGWAGCGYGICIDDVMISGDIAPTPSPIPEPTPLSPIIDSGDYNGDGTSDISIFRPSSGLWAIRGITRIYFGSSSDIPASGDYDGDGTSDIGIFRGTSGLWAIRGITRAYYGSSADIPVPLQFNPSSTCSIGIFRESSGLWAVKGVTRLYFGTTGDIPVPGDYDGDSTKELGVFRGSSGLWALRGVSRIYFGGSLDEPVPGDYTGASTCDVGIFRGSSGLWAIRSVTRSYFGGSSDEPVPADYQGDGRDDIGIFRDSLGLWAIRGLSRVYFGASGDIPVTR